MVRFYKVVNTKYPRLPGFNYMVIELKKFGTTLTSRQTGKEAALACQSILKDIKETETIEVDFEGVLTFSPSWGDEFLTPLLKNYEKRLVLKTTDNPSVLATLEILETTLNKNSRPQNKNADGYSSLSGFDNPEFAQPTPRSTTLPELRATERYGSARRNR